MRWLIGWRALLGLGVVTSLFAFGTGGANATSAFHGIAVTKGCNSPTNIGAPHTCSYQILNVVDTAHDTLSLTGLKDQVHSAGSDASSGNILGSLQLVFSSPTVSCVGGSGAGPSGSPYVGATSCSLPFGTSIQTNDFSFYTVQPADFNLPNQQLTDTATFNWADKCDFGAPPPT